MIGIATAIKDDPIDPFIFSALGNQLANFTRNSNFMVVRDSRKRLDRSFLRPFLRGWQLRRKGRRKLRSRRLRLSRTTIKLLLRVKLASWLPSALKIKGSIGSSLIAVAMPIMGASRR